MDHQQALHTQRFQHRRLFIERRQQRGGRFLRRDHPDGMRIEGHDEGFPALFPRGLHRPRDHRTVPHMHPIENAKREMQRPVLRRPFLQLVDPDRHRFQAPRISEISAREMSAFIRTSGSASLSCAMVTERSRVNFPEFVRRNSLRCAPQPSFSPMSFA